MGLQLGLFINQRMKQELRMTPQLQQAIRLLLLSRVELIEELQQELSANPLLEELEGQDDVTEAQSEGEPTQEELTQEEPTQEEPTQEEPIQEEPIQEEVDWERYLDEQSARPVEDRLYQHNEELPSFENTYSRNESLSEHLTWQLEVSTLHEDVRRVALTLIGYLDDNGYLRDADLEAIALKLNVTAEQAQEGLCALQALDPIGVGARDLRECLLLQARFYELGPLFEAVVSEHLHDIERRRYPQIAKAQGVGVEEIYDVTRRLQQLTPHPGSAFSSESPIYVVPDLYVTFEDGAYVVRTNDEGVPRLKINSYYRRLLRQTQDQEAKQYVTERLNAAQALIKSVSQRKQTIVRVMESIIRHQEPFFREGPEHLKPLILKTIADDLELHESTISRVTSNKYVQTPRGLFDLKFFFNSMIQSDEGSDLASEAVKTKIRKLISEENPRKPYSDQQLATLLAEEGLRIARRTVAKYRESMHILSSAQRKQHF